MAFSTEYTNQVITGSKTTGGVMEENLDLSLDGAAPAPFLSVPAGKTMVISDIIGATGLGMAEFKLQKSVDGGMNWSDMAAIHVNVLDTNPFNLESPLKINGGAGVQIRARVMTPGGATDVDLTVRSFTEP